MEVQFTELLDNYLEKKQAYADAESEYNSRYSNPSVGFTYWGPDEHIDLIEARAKLNEAFDRLRGGEVD